MFFLISGLILMSYITDVLQNNKFNVFHINKIYILTIYSGYFGKNPGILGSRIIKICANIKLNKVVYIKLLNKSVYQYFFT